MAAHESRAATRRVLAAFRAVLPPAAKVKIVEELKDRTKLAIGGQKVGATWVGEGWLSDVRAALATKPRPDLVVARRMSPGARDALANAKVSWVDETGAAEIALGTIIVSRSGRRPERVIAPPDFTPAVVAVAEALLCGAAGTVSATSTATGLSAGSCTSALRVLTDKMLLRARQSRGRGSARVVVDVDVLLKAYAEAAAALAPTLSLTIGVMWRDPVAGLQELGSTFDAVGVSWAATSVVAASLTAPLLTTVGTTEVYVDTRTIAELDGLARRTGLRSLPGGRLILRPFPTPASKRFVEMHDGIPIAPWPRVYVDLRRSGVRGEEAAEHLREVMRERGTGAYTNRTTSR